jgi:hypothetical protein
MINASCRSTRILTTSRALNLKIDLASARIAFLKDQRQLFLRSSVKTFLQSNFHRSNHLTSRSSVLSRWSRSFFFHRSRFFFFRQSRSFFFRRSRSFFFCRSRSFSFLRSSFKDKRQEVDKVKKTRFESRFFFVWRSWLLQLLQKD